MQDIIISEKKLEDYIYDYMCNKDLKYSDKCIGLDIEEKPDVIYRQFDIGAYGIIDLITFTIDHDGSLSCCIYELKKGSIDKEALLQILRYRSGIKEVFKKYDNIRLCNVDCVLIGSELSDHCNFTIIPHAADVYVFTYDIDIVNGLSLEEKTNYYFENINLPETTEINLSYIDYACEDQSTGWYHYQKGLNNEK